MLFASKKSLDEIILQSYKALHFLQICWISYRKFNCRQLERSSESDHFRNDTAFRRLESEFPKHPFCELNPVSVSEKAEQLREIIKDRLHANAIIRSDNLCIFTIRSDNGSVTALSIDLIKNYVGSVGNVAHTLTLFMNDLFTQCTD